MQLLQTLLQMVLHQIDDEMPVIRSKVTSEDTAALKTACHRLKGSLGAVAAMPAFEACTALSVVARAGAVEAYAPALAKLEQEAARLSPCLRDWLAQNEN